TSALIIARPVTDLTAFEYELLERYLNEGGKLLLMLDPIIRAEQPLDNFEKLINLVKLQSPNEVVVDPLAVNASNSPLNPIAAFAAGHPITDATSGRHFVMFQARVVDTIEDETGEYLRDGLLFTGESSWSEPAAAVRSARTAVPPEDPEEIR